MADDIVKWLRETADALESSIPELRVEWHEAQRQNVKQYRQAADEMERLRAEVERLSKARSDLDIQLHGLEGIFP